MKSMFAAALSAALFTAIGPAWADQAATSPVRAWNQIALEAVERGKPNQHQAMRLMTYVSIAQHAALTQAGTADAVATATMRVIGGLIPSQAGFAEERLRQMGLKVDERGERAARKLLSEAAEDGFAAPWTGKAPQTADSWRSLANPAAPPALPAVGGMRTFLIESGSAFRAGPPPAQDSKRFLADLAEVARFTASPTAETTQNAKFYDMSSGTLVAGFWNERAVDLIGKAGLGDAQAVTALAAMNAAMIDAAVASHDTKYTYWVPRPSQVDPSIKPLIGVPNHPSYPSNHAAISTAAALVLTHFFPAEGARLAVMARDAGLSRLHAGIHYRFDMDVGEEIGRKVAAVAIARHAEMLARRSQRLAEAN